MSDRPAYVHTSRTNDTPAPVQQAADIEAALTAGGFLPADNPTLADHNRRAAARYVEQPLATWQEQLLCTIVQHENEDRATRAKVRAARATE